MNSQSTLLLAPLYFEDKQGKFVKIKEPEILNTYTKERIMPKATLSLTNNPKYKHYVFMMQSQAEKIGATYLIEPTQTVGLQTTQATSNPSADKDQVRVRVEVFNKDLAASKRFVLVNKDGKPTTITDPNILKSIKIKGNSTIRCKYSAINEKGEEIEVFRSSAARSQIYRNKKRKRTDTEMDTFPTNEASKQNKIPALDLNNYEDEEIAVPELDLNSHPEENATPPASIGFSFVDNKKDTPTQHTHLELDLNNPPEEEEVTPEPSQSTPAPRASVISPQVFSLFGASPPRIITPASTNKPLREIKITNITTPITTPQDLHQVLNAQAELKPILEIASKTKENVTLQVGENIARFIDRQRRQVGFKNQIGLFSKLQTKQQNELYCHSEPLLQWLKQNLS
jgi:hypothetical protein